MLLLYKKIFADLFSAFVIFFDRPFSVGDTIVFDGITGEIIKIGIKSTRIKAVRGEEVIVSNEQLINSKIQNLRRIEKRRIDMLVGVEYHTTLKQIREIPNMVKNIIDSVENVKLGRVFLSELSDHAINYEIVYYVQTRDVNMWKEAHQNINLELLAAFEKSKIELAFPSQTIYLKKDD